MMYCERCNIDFTEGLRYYKWCGQTLIERRRDTSELQACPNCAAAVQPILRLMFVDPSIVSP